MSAKLSGRKKVLLICDDSVDEKLLNYCTRYFNSYGMSLKKTLRISPKSGRWNASDIDEFYKIAVSEGGGEYLVFKMLGIRTREWLKLLGSSIFIYKNTKLYKMMEYLDKIAIRLVFPFFRLRGQEIYEYVSVHIEEMGHLVESLADIESKDTLMEIIRVAAVNDVYRLKQGTMSSKYWECYKHLEDENYINCGSALGDTILSYLNNSYKFNQIYAYEGGDAEFVGLKRNIALLPEEIKRKIVLKNEYIGIDDQGNNFNCIFCNKRVSLINMDIEGAEMGVLRGAGELIKEQRPVLAIAAYHKATDLWDIPNYISRIADNYKFYLRKYYGYEPNVLNEYVYYAVPIERTETYK